MNKTIMPVRFPNLVGSDGKRFYFGQDLAEAEESFGISAKQLSPDLARVHPNHRIIETKELALTFDTGRLSNMEYLEAFDFKIPLAPYAEIKRWYAELSSLPAWQKTLAQSTPAR